MIGDDIDEQFAACPRAYLSLQVLQECIKLDQEFPCAAPAPYMEQGIALLEIGHECLLAAAQCLPADSAHLAQRDMVSRHIADHAIHARVASGVGRHARPNPAGQRTQGVANNLVLFRVEAHVLIAVGRLTAADHSEGNVRQRRKRGDHACRRVKVLEIPLLL